MKPSPSTSWRTNPESSTNQFRLQLQIIPQLSTEWHSMKKIHNEKLDDNERLQQMTLYKRKLIS